MRRSIVQSHLQFPLTRLLGNGGNVRVLRALYRQGAPLSVAQVARDSAMTRQGVRLVLDGLASQGLVEVLGEPRAQLYVIQSRHPFAETLARLFAQERERWEALLAALRAAIRQCEPIKAAWYYGSVARGEDVPQSDLDVVVLAADGDLDAALGAVRAAVRPVEESLLLSCSVVGVSESDLVRLSTANDAWWREIVRDAKVLVGERPEQLAARACRAAQPT